ncbi:MAG: NADP-dependent oxidoreductase [Balneola sp.]
MKASYYNEFGELDNVTTGTLDKPVPGEGEVLIRIKAAGVNPVDAFATQGMLKDAIPSEFPAIPGWDVAGVVEERGHSARRFKEGDEVYAYARRPVIKHGTFAEYIALPESYLAKRPQKITMEESGGIPLVGLTAYQAIFDAGQMKEGQTLLILGASGGVGTMAIQLAKAKGIKVIGVASKANHDYMKELGADATIDYNDNHVGEAVAGIEPNGIDMIFHCSRGGTLDQVMETGILKKDGHLISITNRNPEINDDVNFQYVFVEPNATQLQHIQELTDDGKVKVHVSKTYSLEETGQALKDVQTLHTRGKLVITP